MIVFGMKINALVNEQRNHCINVSTEKNNLLNLNQDGAKEKIFELHKTDQEEESNQHNGLTRITFHYSPG